jgi:hypothetical protein
MPLVVVITGPQAGTDRPLPSSESMCRLWEKAQAEGTDLLWHPCEDARAVSASLTTTSTQRADLLLLDLDVDGLTQAEEVTLRQALAAVTAPSIEVHHRSDATDASALTPGHASLVSVVVPGDRVAGYAMALAIGLRYLKAQSDAADPCLAEPYRVSRTPSYLPRTGLRRARSSRWSGRSSFSTKSRMHMTPAPPASP